MLASLKLNYILLKGRGLFFKHLFKCLELKKEIILSKETGWLEDIKLRRCLHVEKSIAVERKLERLPNGNDSMFAHCL
jgi:hypothetical protein